MKRPFPNTARLCGLYVITSAPGHVSIARAALRGGATIIQLRDFQTPREQLLEIAREVRQLTRDRAALFVVNDHLELAREVGADGLHLEWAKFGIEDARRELGEDILLSTGVGSAERALAVQEAGADYLGVGPVYPTHSKKDAGAPIGLEGLRAIRDAVAIPIAAIGGLNESNIGQIEAPMACVLSALCELETEAAIEARTRALIAAFKPEREASSF
jgi:thiamine-phosphate pyrophosphorylase